MYIAVVILHIVYDDTDIKSKYYLCNKKLDRLYDELHKLHSRLSKIPFYVKGCTTFTVRYVSFDRTTLVDEGKSLSEV